MISYPNWLQDEIYDKLKNIDISTFSLQNENELAITYLICWSVIEVFSKFIHVVYERKNHAEELRKKIEVFRDSLETSLKKFQMLESDLDEIVNFYSNPFEPAKELPAPVTLKELNVKLQDIICSKVFSTEKPVLASNKRLPSKSESAKAVEILNVKSTKFLDLLKVGKSQSKYYTTRNHIAHEGKIDIQKNTLVKDRIIPVLNAATEIRNEIIGENGN